MTGATTVHNTDFNSNMGGHGGAVGSAVASQLEGCTIPAGDAVGAGGVFSPPCHQFPYPRWGWQKGLSVWSLHVLPVSPRVGTLTKNMQ